MSFLKGFLRSSRCWRREGYTEFGGIRILGNIENVALMTHGHEDEEKKTYEEKVDSENLLAGRSQHFNNTMHKLMGKLAQAALHDDFGVGQKNIQHKNDPDKNFHPTVSSFLQARSAIHEALNGFGGGNEQAIQQWLKENENCLARFLKSLDEIYKLRTTSAKIKDFLWELADTLVTVLILVGLAVAVIKLAGIGILGGAFAHLVAPAATAKTIEGAAAGVAVASTGLFKFFKSDKRRIREAIQQDLHLPDAVQAAHLLRGARR